MIEQTAIGQRVIEERQAKKRRLIKTISQAIIVACCVLVVSIYLTALVVVIFHVLSLAKMAIICALITMLLTVLGMWLLAIWLDIR